MRNKRTTKEGRKRPKDFVESMIGLGNEERGHCVLKKKVAPLVVGHWSAKWLTQYLCHYSVRAREMISHIIQDSNVPSRSNFSFRFP